MTEVQDKVSQKIQEGSDAVIDAAGCDDEEKTGQPAAGVEENEEGEEEEEEGRKDSRTSGISVALRAMHTRRSEDDACFCVMWGSAGAGRGGAVQSRRSRLL